MTSNRDGQAPQNEKNGTLVARGAQPSPFGLVTDEKHVLGNDSPVSGSLVLESHKSLAERASAAVKSTTTYLKERYSEFRLRQRLSRLVRSLEKDPDDRLTLLQLAGIYETGERTDDAAGCYSRLSSLCRKDGRADEMSKYCQKLADMDSPDAPRAFRDLAVLYAEKGRHLDAARACRRVVELYVREHQTSAATGYLKQMPSLGPLTESTRAELDRLIHGAIPPPTPVPVVVPLPRPNLTAPLVPFDTGEETVEISEIFLSGSLKRISAFDVIQIIETNALTGRLDIRLPDGLGTLFFDQGRIIAARFGLQTGLEAAKQALMVQDAPFRVVTTDEIPGDEFHINNNTSLLLDLLREIDEAKRDAGEAGVAGAGHNPFGDPFA